jgi:DNA-binding transcriptional LysR family regulator
MEYDELKSSFDRMPTMTLVQLRHLISLAATASFTHSARESFVTQPALSRSIQALEEELGQPLFDRVGHRSEVTAFGREIVQRARQLIIDADELVACGRRMTDGRAGSLRVGMGSSPAALLMTPVLQLAATHKSSLRVSCSLGDSEQLVRGLRNRTLDALVVEVRSLKPATDLHVSSIIEMRGAFMCRPGHPLTRVRGSLSFEAINEYPIASTLLDDEVARAMIEAYGPKAHPDQCLSAQCNDFNSLMEMVRGTDTILQGVRNAAPELIELPVKPMRRSVSRFGLVTLANRAEAPALHLLRDLLESRMIGD